MKEGHQVAGHGGHGRTGSEQAGTAAAAAGQQGRGRGRGSPLGMGKLQGLFLICLASAGAAVTVRGGK